MKHKPEHINCKAFFLYLEHFQCKNTAVKQKLKHKYKIKKYIYKQ